MDGTAIALISSLLSAAVIAAAFDRRVSDWLRSRGANLRLIGALSVAVAHSFFLVFPAIHKIPILVFFCGLLTFICWFLGVGLLLHRRKDRKDA